MKTTVLGFIGKIGSGKTTLSCKVAESLGWPYTSFGNYVRCVAQQQGLDNSRQTLQELGSLLVTQNPNLFCTNVLNQAPWKPGEPLIIDGIRHLEIVHILQQLIIPSVLRTVYIEVSEATRNSRISIKEELNDIYHQQTETHSTEAQVNTLLRNSADLIIDGSKSINHLTFQVINWLRQAQLS